MLVWALVLAAGPRWAAPVSALPPVPIPMEAAMRRAYHGEKLVDVIDELVIAAYEASHSLRKAAAELGMAKSTLADYLKRARAREAIKQEQARCDEVRRREVRKTCDANNHVQIPGSAFCLCTLVMY